LGPIGTGEPLHRAELGDRSPDLDAAAVGEGIVGQHPLDGDAVGGEERPGPTEKLRYR